MRPRWSPDGKWIAFISELDGDQRIWLMDADGENLRPFATEIHSASDLSWSPDGTKVAITGLVTSDNPPAVILSLTNFDRKFVETEVFVSDPDGTNARKLTEFGSIAMYPTWSPDNKQLVFSLVRDKERLSLTNIDIWTINVDGSEPRQITNEPGVALWPKWSPDGKTILFYHNPPDPSGGAVIPRIIAVSADGKDRVEIDVGEPGGYFPDFRPSPRMQ
ncbi:MAG: hypothetical protein R3C19_00815 [Planctomycetaceae bacterium]